MNDLRIYEEGKSEWYQGVLRVELKPGEGPWTVEISARDGRVRIPFTFLLRLADGFRAMVKTEAR